MTKYEEICRAHKNTIKKNAHYRKKCEEFAVDLIFGLINYLGCSNKEVELFPLKEELKEGQIYKIQKAMNLEDDTFWHFGVRINLYNVGSISLPIMIKGSNEHFIVRLEGIDEKYGIDKNNSEELKAFYDFIFKLIMDDYEKEPFQFYKEEPNIRKIGFTNN